MSPSAEILEQIRQYVDQEAAKAVAMILPHWFAIQTLGRQEKSATQRLVDQGLELFLPVVTEVHRWSDRRKRMVVPLFPGYTFLYAPMSEQIRLAVIRTPGVIDFVASQGRPVPIPETEMESIARLLSQGAPLHAHVYLKAGKRVRIRGGALDGLEGILVGTNPDWSLVITVELIQRSIALRLQGYDIEPA